MNKKNKLITLVIFIMILLFILIGTYISYSINKNYQELNSNLSNEKQQNIILENIIEDSIKNLSLGRHGEYKLTINKDSIVNIITNEKIQEQTFVHNTEIISNNPTETYIVSYSYNKNKRELSIDIQGTLMDTNVTRQIYKLSYKKDKIEFKKIETIILDNI